MEIYIALYNKINFSGLYLNPFSDHVPAQLMTTTVSERQYIT